MQVMWSSGEPMSVRTVLGRLNEGRRPPLAYTTVMTVMARLAEKEILGRELNGRGYVYEVMVPNAASIAVRSVVRDFGDAAIAGFVDEARTDPKLRRRLERCCATTRELERPPPAYLAQARVVKLDSANRSFFALAAAALVPRRTRGSEHPQGGRPGASLVVAVAELPGGTGVARLVDAGDVAVGRGGVERLAVGE